MSDILECAVGVIVKDNRVLLGKKLTGEIGCGKLNGPGGKRKPGESYLQCLIRETQEELGITLDPVSCTRVGRLICHAGNKPYRTMRVDIFRCTSFEGKPKHTDDMKPEWYAVDSLPWSRMHEGDVHWFEKAIRGERFESLIYYRAPGEGLLSYTEENLYAP